MLLESHLLLLSASSLVCVAPLVCVILRPLSFSVLGILILQLYLTIRLVTESHELRHQLARDVPKTQHLIPQSQRTKHSPIVYYILAKDRGGINNLSRLDGLNFPDYLCLRARAGGTDEDDRLHYATIASFLIQKLYLSGTKTGAASFPWGFTRDSVYFLPRAEKPGFVSITAARLYFRLQHSPGQTGGGEHSYSYQDPTPGPSSARKGSRKRPRPIDDNPNGPNDSDDEGWDGDDGQANGHGSTELRRQSSPLFACPFYKFDPTTHYRCVEKYKLKRYGDVKQHIRRCHIIKDHLYCPKCWHRWKKQEEWRAHIQRNNCQAIKGPEDLLANENSLLDDMPPLLTDWDRWYWMWNQLFSSHQPPDSPYVSNGLAEPKALLRRTAESELRRKFPGLLSQYNISLSPAEILLLTTDILRVAFDSNPDTRKRFRRYPDDSTIQPTIAVPIQPVPQVQSHPGVGIPASPTHGNPPSPSFPTLSNPPAQHMPTRAENFVSNSMPYRNPTVASPSPFVHQTPLLTRHSHTFATTNANIGSDNGIFFLGSGTSDSIGSQSGISPPLGNLDAHITNEPVNAQSEGRNGRTTEVPMAMCPPGTVDPSQLVNSHYNLQTLHDHQTTPSTSSSKTRSYASTRFGS